MNTSAIFTVSITALVAVIGWIAVHLLSMRATKQNIIWQNEIAYRKAQLEELYGPIYSMLKTSAVIYKLWHTDKKINEANFEVKKYFESINNEIRKLLTQKTHLIDGGEMPPEFVDFMTSAMIWNWYCTKNFDASFPPHVEELPEVKFPKKFQEYIFTKTEELKRKLDDLYQKNSLNPKKALKKP